MVCLNLTKMPECLEKSVFPLTVGGKWGRMLIHHLNVVESHYVKIKKGGRLVFLLGEYQNKIDSRGRAFVPVKFRDQIGSPVYMVIDDRKCIECYNEDGIKEKYNSAVSKEGGLLRKETVETGLFSSGDTQPIDNQGRIILKPDYIERIGADKDVVFIGANDHFEIWAKDEYDKMRAKISERKTDANEIEDLEEEIRLLEKRKELLLRKKALMAEIEGI